MNCSDIVAQMLDKIRTRGGKGKCDSKLTAPFNEVLHNIDRIGNSCVNLVEVAEDNAIMQSLLAEDENDKQIGAETDEKNRTVLYKQGTFLVTV